MTNAVIDPHFSRRSSVSIIVLYFLKFNLKLFFRLFRWLQQAQKRKSVLVASKNGVSRGGTQAGKILMTITMRWRIHRIWGMQHLCPLKLHYRVQYQGSTIRETALYFLQSLS